MNESSHESCRVKDFQSAIFKDYHKNEMKLNGFVNGTSDIIDDCKKKTIQQDACEDFASSEVGACSASTGFLKLSEEKIDQNSSLKKEKTELDNNENIKELSGQFNRISCNDNVDCNKLQFKDDINAQITNNLNDCENFPADKVGEDVNISQGVHNEEITSIIQYVQYQDERQMPMIMKIIQKDLSEPYSIYTYRYFIHNWPKLCFLAMHEDKCVGAIVCKLDLHRKVVRRGYIAMLAVDKEYRKQGIGSTLVKKSIQEMILGEADEVVLETEVTNKPALQLYEALGFVRDKRLFRYYLNGVDALRLKLWLR